MIKNVFLTDIASIDHLFRFSPIDYGGYTTSGNRVPSILRGAWERTEAAYRHWQSVDHSDTLITLTGGGVADETLKRISN
jgi:hypothetical protein